MHVFDFTDADPSDVARLGGKGAGLADMTAIGLPVPPGFTITTDACRSVLASGRLDDLIWEEILDAVARLEERTGRRFGGGAAPLLVSVRSGAAVSMPGMMDTVLNLGINDQIVGDLARWSGSDHFAWDAYRRLIHTYGDVVLGVDDEGFEAVLRGLRAARGVPDDAQLAAGDLQEATRRFQAHVAEAGQGVPEDPRDQLRSAVEAVFHSWNTPRAASYRQIHRIPEDLGTACTVQMMVFGDLGDTSGTGVCFTRDPSTGQRVPYGDYLPNAQGEDVVAGIRNTLSLDALRDRHPAVRASLDEVMAVLEQRSRDMCDIEFTVEREELWILQTRVGKRTAAAAVRIAVEMADEGLIDRDTALLRVQPDQLDRLLHPTIDGRTDHQPIAVGLNASPGAAVGAAVFDADTAVVWAERGDPVILVRWETTPDDIHGMAAARGILTSHGGKTSHAAVVARGMGIPAVTGVAAMDVDQRERRLVVGDVVVSEGDEITIDGATGSVYLGALPLSDPEPSADLERLLSWADATRRLGVLANADTGPDAEAARAFGAEGIGLARTEHMFLGDRLPVVRRIILDAPDAADALRTLEEMQAADFEQLLAAMDGLPVIVRLLDPPLHEFLPDRWTLAAERAAAVDAGQATDRIDAMTEVVTRLEERNPMLGLRGVRLGIVRPELYRAQVRAALTAVRARLAAGGSPILEIMVPLVSTASELSRMRTMIHQEMAEAALEAPVKIGTMIEIPRAALLAGEIAAEAEFFSFGTNDLTQTTYGFSRDDAEGSFLGTYLDQGILERNPFESLDTEGVGRLIRIAVAEGRAARADLEVGICGEHGGDPDSIAFCHRAGLDYVSCSPPRVPVARLAAAQAALADRGGE